METLFTADPHLGHANILKYCSRTLFMTKYEKSVMASGNEEDIQKLRISKESLNKMNQALIRNWNERVKPEDTVINVGDWCFRNSRGGKPGEGEIVKSIEYEKLLNGKIVFVQGNHDKSNTCKTIIQGLLIQIANHQIYCVHNPAHCNFNYSINFTAHTHNNWEIQRRFEEDTARYTDCINVGVDVWNYRPVKFQEIWSRYCKWKKTYKENINASSSN